MKNWQEDRNYKRIKNQYGTVTNIITVDGQDVEVTEEVFLAYSQMDRYERYQEERKKNRVLSLDQMAEDDVRLEYVCSTATMSPEDIVIAKESATERKSRIADFPKAMALLSDEERQLIQSLYFKNTSLREYAKVLGAPVMTLHYRLQKTLKKLKSFFV